MSSWHTRMRILNTDTVGFVVENNAEQALFAVSGASGHLTCKGRVTCDNNLVDMEAYPAGYLIGLSYMSDGVTYPVVANAVIVAHSALARSKSPVAMQAAIATR